MKNVKNLDIYNSDAKTPYMFSNQNPEIRGQIGVPLIVDQVLHSLFISHSIVKLGRFTVKYIFVYRSPSLFAVFRGCKNCKLGG
jgi:hypothetical protein